MLTTVQVADGQLQSNSALRPTGQVPSTVFDDKPLRPYRCHLVITCILLGNTHCTRVAICRLIDFYTILSDFHVFTVHVEALV